MAENKRDAQIVSEEKTTEVTNVTADKKSAIYDEISELVNQYNKSAEYSEFKVMKEIDKKIADKVQEYSEVAEAECFAECLKAENPMKAAAEMVRYSTVKVRDVKDDGALTRVIEASSKQIDPLRLHKKAKDGIGADKAWFLMIEKLNLLMTCRRAIELGLDPKQVQNTYSMSEEACKIESLLSETDPTKYDKNVADEVLRQDVQKIVDAMLGEGFAVTDVMINYLLMIYTRKDSRKALSVSCANHKYMRTYMLDICHAAVTGNEFYLNYKVKK